MTERTPGLSRRERQIMDVLHRRGDSAVAEVMDNLPDPPSYSAVRATLRILEDKGHVMHREDGPRYVYAPVMPKEEARQAALRHVVRTFFGGSAEQAAVALLGMSDVMLSDADLERLATEIEQARKEGR